MSGAARLGVGTSAYLPWNLTAVGTIMMLVGLALLWSLPSGDTPRGGYKKNGPTGWGAAGPEP